MKKDEINHKLAELEMMKQQMQELQEKIEVANRVESQFQQLASEGKMKLYHDGKVEIVEDPNEREFIQDSFRKEQK